MSAQTPTPVLRHDGVPESESPNGEKARSLDGGDDQTDKDTVVEDGRSDVVIERKSKGVVEMEALAEKINTKYLILLYGGFAILAYVLSLNQYTSADFLDVAVSRAFGQHSLRATVSTITAVFQAVSQPPIAKFADVFGRVNAYLACVALYVIGYIIVPSSQNIYAYAAGNSIYILGITGLFLLQNIIISDISSLRSRYLWTIFPSIPGAINVFVAPIIVDSFLARGLDNWVWGYAMFTIMTPVLAIPIILVLYKGTRPSRMMRAELRAARGGGKHPSRSEAMTMFLKGPSRARWTDIWAKREGRKSIRAEALSLFWQLDTIGLLLCVLGFGLFFVTITIANGPTSEWSDPHCIVLLVLGAVFMVGFAVYEKRYAPHPLIPFYLLKNRDVIGCLLIALFHPMSGRIVNGYFYTFLIVARDESYLSASRMTSIPSFSATIVAIIGALLVRHFRRLKPALILGFTVQTLAYGLMIRFRTSTNSRAEVVIVQILKGFGIGLISFPAQAVIQSATAHEHLAAVTATYLIVFYLTSGIGTAIGGAIWTNVVPKKIDEYFAPINASLGRQAYGDPFTFALNWPMDSPERAAIARAQDEAQRLIVIVGTCVCALGLLTSIFCISNVRLPDTQSIEENETKAEELAREKAAASDKVVTKL